MMQAVSDIYLGWTTGAQTDRHFYWRQLRDMKASAEIEVMAPDGLTFYAGLCGWTLARAHARSGHPAAIAEYLGQDTGFDKAVTDFSTAVRRPERTGLPVLHQSHQHRPTTRRRRRLTPSRSPPTAAYGPPSERKSPSARSIVMTNSTGPEPFSDLRESRCGRGEVMSFWCRRTIRGTSASPQQRIHSAPHEPATFLPRGRYAELRGHYLDRSCIHVLAVCVLVPPRFLKDLLGDVRTSSIAAR